MGRVRKTKKMKVMAEKRTFRQDGQGGEELGRGAKVMLIKVSGLGSGRAGHSL